MWCITSFSFLPPFVRKALRKLYTRPRCFIEKGFKAKFGPHVVETIVSCSRYLNPDVMHNGGEDNCLCHLQHECRIEEAANEEFRRLGETVYADHAGAALYSEVQLADAFKVDPIASYSSHDPFAKLSRLKFCLCEPFLATPDINAFYFGMDARCFHSDSLLISLGSPQHAFRALQYNNSVSILTLNLSPSLYLWLSGQTWVSAGVIESSGRESSQPAQ